jgi:hypothetical protein
MLFKKETLEYLNQSNLLEAIKIIDTLHLYNILQDNLEHNINIKTKIKV